MASKTLFRNTARPDLYVCASCAFKASRPNKTARRWVHMKYLVKVADAEERWAEQAKLIQAGKKTSMLSILEERGLVEKFTGSVVSIPIMLPY
jgi:tyrosyl-tRNA synthetase